MPRKPKKVKLTTRLESSGEGSGWHYIMVSRSAGEQFPSDGRSRRVICVVEGKHQIHCALMPSGGNFFIMLNKALRESLGIVHGDNVTVTLEPDGSKYGMPITEEFTEVLKQDAEGAAHFERLTPGKKRSLIYQVSGPKDIDVRIHRALIIMDHLKENEGKIINELLYEELKRPLVDSEDHTNKRTAATYDGRRGRYSSR